MFGYTARLFATAVLALMLGLPMAASAAMESEFDHFSTGFPLTGGHRNVECESCHRSGIFAGTPRQCVVCHTQQEVSSGAVKPANHIPTTNECQDCHDDRSWGPVRRIDHGAVLGSCTSCHNGFRAQGMSPTHIAINNWSCDDCHRTSGWLPARFRHLNVVPGQCASCHNGVTATGSTPTTIHSFGTASSLSCDACHTTRGWIPAHYNHVGVAPGSCTTCHNGSAATARPTDTIHSLGTASTASCDACHTTRAWVPAHFDHSSVTPGTCSTCHDGVSATGKNAGHLSTTASCDQCHNTRAWTPAGYDHSQAAYYPDHRFRTLSCSSCHGTSGYTIAWAFPPPDCITCHESDFRREHSSSKRASYHNCTSGCHEHSNALSRGKW
jgi:hypothetical protein